MASSSIIPSSPSRSSNSPRQRSPSSPHLMGSPPKPIAMALPASSSPITSSRRLPPPCWSHEETEALIDSYRDKWYTLRRGNLRAAHWQEVADAVAHRCSHITPPKTSVQCRHKMEKLRKRYRSELQRALSIPNHKFSSSWVHFKKMDAMEKGPSSSAVPAVDSDEDGADYGNENDDYADDSDNDYDNGSGSYLFQNLGPQRGGYNGRKHPGSIGNGAGPDGFRIRVPRNSPPQSGFRMKNYAKLDAATHNYNKPKYNFSSSPGFDEGFKYSTRIVENGSGTGSRSIPGLGKRDREGSDEDNINSMVQAIEMLGEGFVKMEKMKIEMMREIEQMRMDMEMKRTEMILESQQRIIEAFVEGISENRNKKNKPET